MPILLQINTPAKRSIVITDPDSMRLEFFVPGAGPLPDGMGSGPEGAYVI